MILFVQIQLKLHDNLIPTYSVFVFGTVSTVRTLEIRRKGSGVGISLSLFANNNSLFPSNLTAL